MQNTKTSKHQSPWVGAGELSKPYMLFTAAVPFLSARTQPPAYEQSQSAAPEVSDVPSREVFQ